MAAEDEAQRVAEAAGTAPPQEPADVDDDWEMDGTEEEPQEPQTAGASVPDTGEEVPPSEAGAPPADPPSEPAPDGGTPKQTKIRKVTEYVVLVETKVKFGEDTVSLWKEVGTFAGPKSLDAAHKQLVADGQPDHGALVAVPARSWKPKRQKEKTREPVMVWE